MDKLIDQSELDQIIENFKKLGELSTKKPKEDPPVTLSKDEFIAKLGKCMNFRSQIFAESIIYHNIIHQIDKDKLYDEYLNLKKNKIGILSQFVKGPFLFVSEKFGDRVRVKYLEYDYEIIGFHNFPMSDDIILPTDEEQLKKWELKVCYGCYSFEPGDNDNAQLSHVRIPNIKKDVFLYNNEIIVHAQDFNAQDNKELDEDVFTRFTDYLEVLGGDKFEQIFDKILSDFPELNKKADQ